METSLFSLLLDGVPLSACDAAVSREENGAVTRTVFRLPGGLTITNVRRAYPDFDACEWVNYFENTGNAPSPLLSEIHDACIELPAREAKPLGWTAYLPDFDRAMQLYAPRGSTWDYDDFSCDIGQLCTNVYTHLLFPGDQRHYAASGGRSSEDRAPFFEVHEDGDGALLAVGWTGQWEADFRRTENALHVTCGIEGATFRLLPGEAVRTASCTVMRYAGMTVAEARNKWRRFLRTHISPVGRDGRPDRLPFCAGLWGGMSTAGALERIRRVTKNRLPFDCFWMDAGWYGTSTAASPDEFEGDWGAYIGDWRPNPTHHPDGLADVAAAVHAAGCRFLLWFEPERVTKKAPLYTEHPEYLLFSPDGDGENALLYLGNEEAWQYCFRTLSDIIERLHIDIYRQDFNIVPLPFFRHHDTDGRRGMTEIRHINGLYRLWDALLARFPHLLIDNCAAGGRRLDIETLRRSVPLWRSDFQCPANFPPEGSQVHSMNYGAWMPYSGTGTGREWGDVYRFRSSYAPGMGTNFTFSERDTFGDDPAMMDFIRRYGEEYRQVRPYLSEDMYPLTAATHAPDAWCVTEYHRPKGDDGVLLAYRHERSPFAEGVFPLFGLAPERSYVFTDADTGDMFRGRGDALMRDGVRLSLPERRSAKVFFFRAE